MAIPLPPPPGYSSTPKSSKRPALTDRQLASDAQVEELLAGGEFSLTEPNSEPDAEVDTEVDADLEYEIDNELSTVNSQGRRPGSQFRKPSRRLPEEREIRPASPSRSRMRIGNSRPDVPIYYSPEELGEKTIHQLIVLWKFGTPISVIAKKVNADRMRQGMKLLTHIDLYTFFYKMREDGRVEQRREPSSELTLDDARDLYLGWKEGIPGVHLAERVTSKKTAHSQIIAYLRSITTRYRETVRDLPHGRSPVEGTLVDIMKYGERHIIGEHSAMVIFPHKLPPSLKAMVRAMPCFAGSNDPDVACDSETIVAIAESLKNPAGEHFEFYDQENQEARRNAPSEVKKLSKTLLQKHKKTEKEVLDAAAKASDEPIPVTDVTNGFRFRGGVASHPEPPPETLTELSTVKLPETNLPPDVTDSEATDSVTPEQSSESLSEAADSAIEVDIDQFLDDTPLDDLDTE